MKPFALLSDNSCAFTKDLRERFKIDGIVFGNIQYPDGHTEKADIDWERTTPEEYFGSMTSKKFIYKTSCANIDEIKDLYRPFLEDGRDILMVTISSALSGTYQFAVKAAEELQKDYPDRHIRVIDSYRYSFALGMLLADASALRDEGKGLDEVADWIEANKRSYHQIGIMDDMFFLARTGRVSKAKAFFGNLIGVEPMADIGENGLSEVIGKGKGKKKSLIAAVEYLKATIVEPEKRTIFICHSLREKEANFYKQMLEESVHPKEIIIGSIDQSSGANIGPGMAVMFYFGKPASKGLEEEKALLTNLLK